MQIVIVLFWISLVLLFYTYAGYAIFIFIYNLLQGKKHISALQTGDTFKISLVVPVYNEADCIRQKIENCLQLNYPADRLEIIFITDGSTDDSNAIIEKYERIRLLHQPVRKGKMAAIKRAVGAASHPILVFTDANTLLNAESLNYLVKHYAVENIGGVAGEKKIDFRSASPNIGLGEGLYWQYESALKKLDAGFNTVIGAAGELFSIRAQVFIPAPDDTILDDFVISMNICQAGYKIAYEPNAFAVEMPSVHLSEERKRRVRIAAGTYQVIQRYPGLLNFFKHFKLSFQYFSRCICRWVGSPVSLIVLFITSGLLWWCGLSNSFYTAVFFAQVFFYGLAVAGWLLYVLRVAFGALFLPFYFTFMHLWMVAGFVKYVTGRQTVLWERSKRMVSSSQ